MTLRGTNGLSVALREPVYQPVSSCIEVLGDGLMPDDGNAASSVDYPC